MENKSNLKTKYQKEVRSKLAEEFGKTNPMAEARVEKVVINVGVGEAAKSKETMEAVSRDLALITGQKPAIRKARVSVASFGVRQGMPVGLKVTLRGDRMYAFLERLFSITLPRLRDFRGLSIHGFDKSGNYTLGFEEQTVFPEIDLGKVVKPFGLEVTIVTNTNDAQKAKRLLELMGMPFEK
jgi:large subunit ribosomal protein L5